MACGGSCGCGGACGDKAPPQSVTAAATGDAVQAPKSRDGKGGDTRSQSVTARAAAAGKKESETPPDTRTEAKSATPLPGTGTSGLDVPDVSMPGKGGGKGDEGGAGDTAHVNLEYDPNCYCWCPGFASPVYRVPRDIDETVVAAPTSSEPARAAVAVVEQDAASLGLGPSTFGLSLPALAPSGVESDAWRSPTSIFGGQQSAGVFGLDSSEILVPGRAVAHVQVSAIGYVPSPAGGRGGQDGGLDGVVAGASGGLGGIHAAALPGGGFTGGMDAGLGAEFGATGGSPGGSKGLGAFSGAPLPGPGAPGGPSLPPGGDGGGSGDEGGGGGLGWRGLPRGALTWIAAPGAASPPPATPGTGLTPGSAVGSAIADLEEAGIGSSVPAPLAIVVVPPDSRVLGLAPWPSPARALVWPPYAGDFARGGPDAPQSAGVGSRNAPVLDDGFARAGHDIEAASSPSSPPTVDLPESLDVARPAQARIGAVQHESAAGSVSPRLPPLAAAAPPFEGGKSAGSTSLGPWGSASGDDFAGAAMPMGSGKGAIGPGPLPDGGFGGEGFGALEGLLGGGSGIGGGGGGGGLGGALDAIDAHAAADGNYYGNKERLANAVADTKAKADEANQRYVREKDYDYDNVEQVEADAYDARIEQAEANAEYDEAYTSMNKAYDAALKAIGGDKELLDKLLRAEQERRDRYEAQKREDNPNYDSRRKSDEAYQSAFNSHYSLNSTKATLDGVSGPGIHNPKSEAGAAYKEANEAYKEAREADKAAKEAAKEAREIAADKKAPKEKAESAAANAESKAKVADAKSKYADAKAQETKVKANPKSTEAQKARATANAAHADVKAKKAEAKDKHREADNARKDANADPKNKKKEREAQKKEAEAKKADDKVNDAKKKAYDKEKKAQDKEKKEREEKEKKEKDKKDKDKKDGKDGEEDDEDEDEDKESSPPPCHCGPHCPPWCLCMRLPPPTPKGPDGGGGGKGKGATGGTILPDDSKTPQAGKRMDGQKTGDPDKEKRPPESSGADDATGPGDGDTAKDGGHDYAGSGVATPPGGRDDAAGAGTGGRGRRPGTARPAESPPDYPRRPQEPPTEPSEETKEPEEELEVDPPKGPDQAPPTAGPSLARYAMTSVQPVFLRLPIFFAIKFPPRNDGDYGLGEGLRTYFDSKQIPLPWRETKDDAKDLAVYQRAVLDLFDFYGTFTDKHNKPINGEAENIDSAINPRSEYLERDSGSEKGAGIPHVSTRAKGAQLDKANNDNQTRVRNKKKSDADAAVKAAEAKKTAAQALLDSKGPKTLDQIKQAKADLAAANGTLPGLRQKLKDADAELTKPLVAWDDMIVTLRRKKGRDGKPLTRNEAAKIDDKGGKDSDKKKEKQKEADKDKAVNNKADKLAPTGEKELGHYTK